MLILNNATTKKISELKKTFGAVVWIGIINTWISLDNILINVLKYFTGVKEEYCNIQIKFFPIYVLAKQPRGQLQR
jgi:hypothetical protein